MSLFFHKIQASTLQPHWNELQKRVIRCCAIFVIGFLICYHHADLILDFLRQPLFKVMPPSQRNLYFTSLFENFMTHLKVAGYAALFLFSPYYFYEFWKFIVPGLSLREKKLILSLVLASTLFFLGGTCFAYWILFPIGFKFFITYGTPTHIPLLSIEIYYTTCLKFLFLFGMAFELPVLLCVLSYLNILNEKVLKKNRKTAILVIALASAFFTPPDAVSMLLLAIPLILFYELSLWLVPWLKRRL